MAIVAASRSWKETRDVMMRKYLAAEKMVTEADLAAVQRKNFATYNDFLREFTLVALRIPGVTDRIMSKYFLRQFSEFDKDKILSAYQQTRKFVNTRDVDFSTVTDLAEKTVVTETLALLKEGEVIDVTGRTGDKVKKGIESLHERVHGVDGRMRRAIIMLNGLEITAVEAEPVVDIIWDQLRGRGPQVNFILESDERDRVNATTRLGTAGRRIIRDTVMEEVVGGSAPQAEPEAGEPEKVYGKPREEESTDKVTGAKKKFRYQIPILTMPEMDFTLSKLLGTMVSVSFQTILQVSPRLLKGLRQLLTLRQVEIDESPEPPEEEREEKAPQEIANLQRSHGDLEDLEKAFADIRLSLPDREGGEVMRAPPETKLSFHALPVGKLKIQIGTHHTDALVDGGAEITLIRRDFATITGCTVNKEVTGRIRGAGVDEAEPIDAFLEYEGGTLAVDNGMMGEECASGELLILTLEKGAPAVVAELREELVTTRGRKEEKDSWGAIVGPKEELIAMAVEGSREAVMSLMESWERKKLQWMVNQMKERKDEDQEGREFFHVQIYEGIFREIGLPIVGNKQPMEVSFKAREEAERFILDARDNLSGFVEVVAFKRKAGRSVADWIKDFYLRHPFIRRFLADNGTKFVNQGVLGMLKRLCVPIKLIEPYHPEANAPVEKGHRTLKNTIAKLVADNLGSWPRYLKQAVFSENMTPKRMTGCIPTKLWYERAIDFPVKALMPTWNRLDDDPRTTTEELIEARCQQVLRNEEVMEDIANRVLDSRMRDKAR
ncbi:hypothetical protein CBR_g41028 [Chara braunii]|uniref:Integrase catalytic domain-containing protein n=1 Tax=Chara braunii TaxID=69332 RepID=A0A388LV38_CHABU|nr:hypothetical protein CBR_g41028 [Chara braunii]|eukprot:GBG86125.1 hypothetical protein CBR_g41028 [Chara braunii]